MDWDSPKSLRVIFFLFLSSTVFTLPIDRDTTTIAHAEVRGNKTAEEWDTGLEYDRYLKEIVSVLEDDVEFRKKMESADPEHFKTGEIAKELNFVSHNVRSKLDEIKRRELTRLRSLVKEQVERNELNNVKIPGHLDPNKDEFDENDLKRLIQQTTSDLQAADEARRTEFKEYELNKEHQRREKLKAMDERSRQEEEKKYQEEQKKHQDHPALHHPGSKAQLEQVWEETDGLPKEEFDPKTFFKLHDLNQDHILDQGELEALFQKELDKIYDPNNPEDDLRERIEEMARMREHVMKEIDTNRDGMISLDEWLTQAQKQSFEKDPGWETLDQQPMYNENELREYERQLAMHDQNYQYPVQGPHAGYQGGHPQQGFGQYPGQGPPSGYNPGGYNSGPGGPNPGFGNYPGNQPYNQPPGSQQTYQQPPQQAYQQPPQQAQNPSQQRYNQNNAGGTPPPYNPQQGGSPPYNQQQGSSQNQQHGTFAQKPPNAAPQSQGGAPQYQQHQQLNNQGGMSSTYAPHEDPNAVKSGNVVGGQNNQLNRP